ncbi:LuxR family transcriptional regulator [Nocardioides sp. Root1257]|uniref:response regulator transcription factor n=1 Tax=unclassified Nocardioides TaxID=2615069 RepID=UPI0006FD3347|nr:MULTISPECIES: response regulator transcription factor [unclassified Nocardioides]KQW43929.1 LuxR family transcriptional regulator [Nocardioides sp. Root1257]KRC42370.1 LuxR family transcriptional regulator [Nocardioides sp. Root224]
MVAAGPIRVAVVNDYELVVLGVASALAPYADRIEVVELDSQLPLLSSVDILLYDTFGQVQGDSIDLEALGASSSRRVVIFSWNTEPQLVDRALRLGADGYVSKAVGADALVGLLERVHAGDVVTPSTGSTDPDDQFGRWPGDQDGLSARESEILGLITQGLSNEEIAARAFVSKNTVKSHIRAIYRKIGVSRRSQAVAWGMRNGMAPQPRRTTGADVAGQARDLLDPG